MSNKKKFVPKEGGITDEEFNTPPIYPIVNHGTYLSVGDVIFHYPIFIDTKKEVRTTSDGKRYTRNYSGLIDFVNQYKLILTYIHPPHDEIDFKDTYTMLGKAIGFGFKKRWNAHVLEVWVKPLRELEVYWGYCTVRNANRVNVHPARCEWAIRNLEFVKQLKVDNMAHMIPVFAQHNSTSVHGLRELYGKNAWKRLCSLKVYVLSQMYAMALPQEGLRQAPGPWRQDEGEGRGFTIESYAKFMGQATRMPKTYLANWRKHFDGQSYSQIIQKESFFEWMLYNRSEWKVTDQISVMDLRVLFNDTYHMADGLDLTINPHWSVRRMRAEHDRLGDQHRATRLLDQFRRRNVDLDVDFAVSPIWPLLVVNGNVEMRLMTSPQEVITQGVKQRHCLGSYALEVAIGTYVVYAIYVDGELYSHAMYFNKYRDGNKEPQMVQHYCAFNKRPDNDLVVNMANHLKYNANPSVTDLNKYDEAMAKYDKPSFREAMFPVAPREIIPEVVPARRQFLHAIQEFIQAHNPCRIEPEGNVNQHDDDPNVPF
jgi:hypothetical protein